MENANILRVPYGCQSEIVIPVVDADDDVVKCRWSTGSECVSICGALPNATIDSVSCVYNDTFKLLLHVNVFRTHILRRNHCRKWNPSLVCPETLLSNFKESVTLYNTCMIIYTGIIPVSIFRYLFIGWSWFRMIIQHLVHMFYTDTCIQSRDFEHCHQNCVKAHA